MSRSPLRPHVPEWHGDRDPPSRARITIDRADALLSMENFERYRSQSADTRDNTVAQFPARAPLSKELSPV